MGYSSPKKPLDLKEFLSQPATRRPNNKFFGNRKNLTTQPKKPDDEVPAKDDKES